MSSVLIELWVPGSYLEYLRDLEKRVDEDWPAVAESLEAIWTALLARKDAIVNLTADDRTLIRAESHVATLLDTLPEHSSGLVSWDQQLPLINEGLVIPTQVNIFDTCYLPSNVVYSVDVEDFIYLSFIVLVLVHRLQMQNVPAY